MMNSAPKLKELATRLLAYESAASQPASAVSTGVFRVCEKLRLPLVRFMGVGGFLALLSRALALASVDVVWLRRLQVRSNGSLEGLAEIQTELDPEECSRGEAAVVTQLAGLLLTFIGPGLTLGLLRDAWPKASFDGLNL
jgi:hypothetical protein